MTEQDNGSMAEPTALEEDVKESSEKTQTREEVPEQRSSRWRWLVLFAALLLAAGFGLTAYVGWQYWQQTQNELVALRADLAALEFEVAEEDRRLTAMSEQQTQVQERWQAAYQQLETLVVQSAQRLSQSADRAENRWQLEEALTLTRLAEQRLELDANSEIAVGMLAAADRILQQLNQAAVLPLRRQLANDILALESTAAVDVNGLYFELEAIATQLREIEWQVSLSSQTPIDDDADLAEGFWHGLKQMFVVTRLEVPAQARPLLTEFERWRQQALMLIQQAQLALLSGNQPLFDAALIQLLQSLDPVAVQYELDIIIQRLQSYQSSQLNPAWPDIHASVEVLEQYLSQQLQTPQVESDASGDGQ